VEGTLHESTTTVGRKVQTPAATCCLATHVKSGRQNRVARRLAPTGYAFAMQGTGCEARLCAGARGVAVRARHGRGLTRTKQKKPHTLHGRSTKKEKLRWLLHVRARGRARCASPTLFFLAEAALEGDWRRAIAVRILCFGDSRPSGLRPIVGVLSFDLCVRAKSRARRDTLFRG